MLKDIILVIQIITAALLIIIISIQTKGTGLGRTFGQSANIQFKRRGIEKLIFKFTFIISFIFILISTIQIFI